MTLKWVIFCASVAVASCAFIDLNEQLQHQQEMRQLQNDQIREHQELQHQQRQDQLHQLMDARRVQEQFIRDQEQERMDRINEGRHYLNNNFNNHHQHQHHHNVHNNNHHHQEQPHHHNQQHHHQQHQHNNNAFWQHNHHNTPVIHLQPAIVNVPSSSRHFNAHDDSNYNFAYTVSDMTTGDFKTHEETKVGDQVHGKYTMLDSDGFQRTVNYRADDVHGFDADVRRDPAHPGLIFNNQHQHGHSHQRHQFSHTPNSVFFTTTHPRSTAIAQVSRIEDGAQSNYVTATTNF